MKQRVTDTIVSVVVVSVITCLVNWGIFVTFKDMYAYAAPKDSIDKIERKLDRIESLTIKLCMKQHIDIPEE